MEGEETDSKGQRKLYGGENVLISTVAAGYSGIYILIKTLSMGTFTIRVFNYASIKLLFFLKKRASHNCKIKNFFKANKIT